MSLINTSHLEFLPLYYDQTAKEYLKNRDEFVMNSYKYFSYQVELFERKYRHRKLHYTSIVISGGDPFEDRIKALELCQAFRQPREIETRIKGLWCTSRVRLMSNSGIYGFVISGGEYIENVYGLAKEAAILNHSNYEYHLIEKAFLDSPYEINGELVTFPEKSTRNKVYNDCFRPEIIASQMDITYEHALKNYYNTRYEKFQEEIQKYLMSSRHN